MRARWEYLKNFYSVPCRYAEKSFRREGISIWTSHHVDKVEAVCLHVSILRCISLMLYQGKLHVKEQGEGKGIYMFIAQVFDKVYSTIRPACLVDGAFPKSSYSFN